MQFATAVEMRTMTEMVVKVAFFQMELGIRAMLPFFSWRFIQNVKVGMKTTLMTRKAIGRALRMLSTSADSMLMTEVST